MSKSTDLLAVLESEFEIVRELGHGGASIVFLARDRELEREVAIKIIDDGHAADPEAQARFQREARTLARLHHPNIVQLYRAKRLPDGRLALVMQHMAGPSLREVLLRDGALPWQRAQAVVIDIARALAFLHQRGIVHRDVKPENIYIEPEDGRALLADFGIAKSNDGLAEVTVTGAVIGTPAYMSPEQVDGHSLDGRSDLYNLGLLAHEMLSGCKPWAGEGIYAIIYKQKHEDLPSLETLRAEVPPHLRRIVERALAKDRDERWGSAKEMIAALENRVGPIVLAPRATPPAASEPEPRRPIASDEDPPLMVLHRPDARRRLLYRGMAGLALVSVVAVAALANTASQEGEPAGVPAPEVVNGQVSDPAGDTMMARVMTDPSRYVEIDEAAATAAAGEAPAAPAAAPVAEPAPAEGQSALLIRELSGRIAQLERQLVARLDRPEPTSTSAPAERPRPEEAPPAVPERVIGRPAAGPVAARGAVVLESPRAGDPTAAAPGVVPPQLINRSAVATLLERSYPPTLRRTGEATTVLVRVLVDRNGRVTDAAVGTSSGVPLIDQAAIRVAHGMRFTPAHGAEGAVVTWAEVPLQFAPPGSR